MYRRLQTGFSILAICLSITAAAIAQAPLQREWTEASGERKVVATLVAAGDQTALFIDRHSRKVQMALTRFSPADRAVIMNWRKMTASEDNKQTGRALEPLLTGLANVAPPSMRLLGDLAQKIGAPAKKTKDEPSSDAGPPKNILYIRLSREWLEQAMCPTDTRRNRVDEMILGTRVLGWAETTSRPQLQLIPDENQARCRLLVRGESHSQTTSYAGPVRIHYRGTTRYAAAKEIILALGGATGGATSIEANTVAQVVGITSTLPGLRGRIATRIAYRREADQHEEAQAISNSRAERQIARDIDNAVDSQSQGLSGEVLERLATYGGPLHIPPTSLHLSTSEDALQIEAVINDDARGRIAEPAARSRRSDIEVHIHRSLAGGLLPSRRSIAGPLVQGAIEIAVRELLLGMLGDDAGRSLPLLDFRHSANGDWVTMSWTAAASAAPANPVLEAQPVATR